MSHLTLLTLVTLAGAQGVRGPAPAYHELPDVRLPAPATVHSVRSDVRSAVAGPEVAAPAAGPRPARDAADQLRSTFRAPDQARLQFDVDADGRHYVAGRAYKASFGQDGATFVPYLGSDAPRNFPVRFALSGATQGGDPVALTTPELRRDAARFVLDQGAVRGEYVAGLDGLEQLFVVDAPLGVGDLVLDLDFESELVPRPNGAGWLFEGEHGAVSYGAAFVVDADGARLDLATESTGAGFRFTVPAEFLADAAWPIAVDPFITNFTIDLDPKDQLEVDVAYDPTTEEYLVVFEEVFSIGDSDVKSWSIDTNGAPILGSESYLDFTFVNCTRPRVAMTNVRRQFLTVFVQGAAGSPRRIAARSRHADTDLLGTTFLVDENTAGDRFEADVCGDSFQGTVLATHFTVVWRRYWSASDSDVVARAVNEDGTFVSGENYVTNFVGVSDEQPSISECLAPATDQSVVVWRRLVSGSTYTVHAALLDFNGAVVTSEHLLASAANVSNPQVSGLSYSALPAYPGVLTYVACWERDFFTDSDIEAVVVAGFPGTPAVSSVINVSVIENVDYLLDQVSPDVVSLGDRWVISQSAVYPGYTDFVTRATTLNIVGDTLGISERFLALTGTFDETLTPKTAGRHEAGQTNDLRLLTAWIQQTTFGSPGDVYGAVHTAGNPNTCAAQYAFCYGNPNSSFQYSRSFLMVEGDFSTTGSKRLVATDMTFNAFGYFLTSQTVNPGGITPPGSAGVLCLGGAIGRYSGSIQNSGPSGAFALNISPLVLSQPTGPVAAVAGQTWYFQAWHRDVTPGGAPTSNFTNAVALPFL